MKRDQRHYIILYLVFAFILPSQGKTRHYKQLTVEAIIDTVLLKVNYLKTYYETTDDLKKKKSIFELRIGEEYSSFHHNEGQFHYDHPPKEIMDSARKSKDSLDIIQRYVYQAINEYKRSSVGIKVPDMIYKNYPKRGWITGKAPTMAYGANMQYEEPINELPWQLEDGDSIVCGYPCGKATTTFHGRTWHVWYTLDIPYSDGPWKLCGLPGLILKATDSSGEFDFTAIAIEEEKRNMPDLNMIKIYNHNMVKISPQLCQQLLIMMYDDETNIIRHIKGVEESIRLIKKQEEFGVPFLPQHKKPCLIEYYGKKE